MNKIKSTKSKIVVSFEFGTNLRPESTNTISRTKELAQNEIFATDTLDISPKEVDKLGTDYEANVNAYSKGKAKDLKFLDCNHLQDKIANLLGGKHVIECDLLKMK